MKPYLEDIYEYAIKQGIELRTVLCNGLNRREIAEFLFDLGIKGVSIWSDDKIPYDTPMITNQNKSKDQMLFTWNTNHLTAYYNKHMFVRFAHEFPQYFN